MPDGSPKIESETVMFSEANRKHAGVYQCTASNGHGREASKLVEVVVQYSPVVEVTEVFVSTYSGQDKVELVCNVHAFPAPVVVWNRRGEVITESGDGRVRINVAGSLRHERHSLVISQVKEEDFGEYSCSASNSLGEQRQTIQLSGTAASLGKGSLQYR